MDSISFVICCFTKINRWRIITITIVGLAPVIGHAHPCIENTTQEIISLRCRTAILAYLDCMCTLSHIKCAVSIWSSALALGELIHIIYIYVITNTGVVIYCNIYYADRHTYIFR